MSTRSTCPYCGVGCGVELSGARESLHVAGDAKHPANRGLLCSKGSALGETVSNDTRLLAPMIGAAQASWAQAVDLIAARFKQAIAEQGPDSVAFYVSGQLLTEDYYVANKLMKGFIGSGNIDTNSRLCMASAVSAHKQAFGEDVVPGCYADLEIADQIVFSGHNAAWTHPVLYRRMEAAKERGQRHIVIDPRETDTARGAWLHLKLASQTDVRLWNGLLAFLLEHGFIDRAFIADRTNGFDALRAVLERDDQSPAAIALDCGLALEDVRAFYLAFAHTPKTVTLFSQGANQSAQGVNKGLAIINAHLATGRVSKPGASPFSITGQPNAMGGRETGGMANTLAAHMDFSPEEVDRVRRFWRAPRIAPNAGLKAVDMFEAVHSGRIKALWVMATNPAVSMPNAGRVREALEKCPFVVVSDVAADTDTSQYAHVRLPALAWGEKDGAVTNSERCISRQRAALEAPGEARADWRIVADVARAMGHGEAFDYETPADIFREFAALTAFENDGARVLDLGPLATLSDRAYDDLAPVRWPVKAHGGGTARPFLARDFPTEDGRARFKPVSPAAPAGARTRAFPLALNTGRLRDQWHTMTRTGLSARLMRHAPEPMIDVHPEDAARFGLVDGALAEVRTAFGAAMLNARVTTDVRPGEMFAPIHWSADFAPHARICTAVNPDFDPASGQPEFKHTPARIAPAQIAWRAFFVSRARKDPPASLWWRRIPQEAGMLYEIAAGVDAPAPREIAALLFDDQAEREIISAGDSGGFVRMASLHDNQLERAFFATTSRGLPARDWLLTQLASAEISDADRRMLLAGGGAVAPRAKTVCACFDVDADQISALAAAEPGCSVARVGAVLKAGSNCGSCRTEIAQLLTIDKEPRHEAA